MVDNFFVIVKGFYFDLDILFVLYVVDVVVNLVFLVIVVFGNMFIMVVFWKLFFF